MGSYRVIILTGYNLFQGTITLRITSHEPQGEPQSSAELGARVSRSRSQGRDRLQRAEHKDRAKRLGAGGVSENRGTLFAGVP